MSDLAFVAAGLVLLIVGGEMLVRGAVAVAERAGMSPLLIGLTLVGFGTSTPELVTSVEAALIGSPGIAVGNVVGSNIANILLIVGIAAVVSPITVASRALERDGAVVLAVAVVFTVIGLLFPLDRLVGACLITFLIAYLWFAWWQESADGKLGHTAAYEKAKAYDELHAGPIAHQAEARGWAERLGAVWPLLLALAGLVIVVGGGKLLVDGAVGMARTYGISEAVIGLTIVAVGTSLPELVTSLIAAVRKHADVALGNVMGSNIYNVLGIAGTTGVISPTAIPEQIVRYDNFVMLAASVGLLVFAQSGRRITRLEGALLLAAYIAYIVSLLPR